MTRINTIDPKHLLDQHLFIEYREITRVAKLARGPKPGEKFPQQYTLGTGHVTFFYNKGTFLQNRIVLLYNELIARGYKPTLKVYPDHAPGLHKDWFPSRADHITNLSRLQSKQIERPSFYKLNSKPAPEMHYHTMFEEHYNAY
jgi:deoxyribonuclease (pyrimidine dimer)